MNIRISKAKNCVFAVIAALLLAVVGIHITGADVGVWSKPATSWLEGREYSSLQDVSKLKNLLDGSFQGRVERFVADRVPYRDEVLLTNAGAQRSLIELARLPFGYENYPSFFGSSEIICTQVEAVYPLMDKKSKYNSRYWEGIAQSLEALVTNSNSVSNWRIVLAERANYASSTPVHGLVANSADYSFMTGKLEEVAPGPFEIVNICEKDPENYTTMFFRTDHHMQIQGSIDAYEKVLVSLGKTPKEFKDFYIACYDPYYGSNGRTSLCDYYSDAVYDVDYPHSNITFIADGQTVDYAFIDRVYHADGSPYVQPSKFANIGFHGAHHKLIEYENHDCDISEGNLLLIGDSFTDNCGRIFAESYKHVYEIDPRYFEGSMKDFIAAHDIDDVIIFGSMEVLDTEASQNCFAR